MRYHRGMSLYSEWWLIQKFINVQNADNHWVECSGRNGIFVSHSFPKLEKHHRKVGENFVRTRSMKGAEQSSVFWT